MKKIALIGSTGSIGTQVINVALKYADKFEIISLSGGYNSRAFLEQVNKLKPKVACFSGKLSNKEINALPKETEYFFGEDAYLNGIIEEADIVVVALVGFIGVKAVLKAASMKKDIALSNKECLVVAGDLVMNSIKDNGVRLSPIDSEHSAVWQALNFGQIKDYNKIILTASGGALREIPIEKLPFVTAKEALKHPTWNMGNKITIDCATMMNKGFEVMEAMRLFNATLDKIDVIIHPESIIHSMVEFNDGSVLAQMSYPTMEVPIALSLTYPERLTGVVKPLDFASLKSLSFKAVDHNRYPCFDLALDSAKKDGNYPCALNAANEIAVSEFLKGNIAYNKIEQTIACVLDKTKYVKITNYDLLLEQDLLAREMALKYIGEHNA